MDYLDSPEAEPRFQRRVRYEAIGPHALKGDAWVLVSQQIKTASGEIVWVHAIVPDENQKTMFFIGDGEIVEFLPTQEDSNEVIP